jgi:hypothetical protein
MKKRNWTFTLLLSVLLLVPGEVLALNGNDFKPLATGGFGDSANSYSWGLTEFKGDVYVSTGRHHFWSMVLAIQVMLGEPIPIEDYIEGPPGNWGEPDWANAHRAEIWRLRSGAWDRVYQSGTYFIPETDPIISPLLPFPLWGSFPNAYSYRTLGVFGDHIYALGVGTWMPPIANSTVLRSTDGDTWEDVSANVAATTNVRGFATWRNNLYIAASIRGGGQSGAGGCVVFRKNDTELGDPWEQVSEVGFGDLNNEEIYYLAVFNDCLYASTVNYLNGFEVWKTDGTIAADGKLAWQQVIKEGFGDTWNQYGMTMQAFGDYLYIGTAVGAGMVLKDGQLAGTRAIDIIRLDRNDNAQLVVGAYAPSDPPPGWPTFRIPLSWLPAGFGNPLNVYTWHMGVYKNKLYVGTLDLTGIALFLIKEQILSDPAAAMESLRDLAANTGGIPSRQFNTLKRLNLEDSKQAAIASNIIDSLIESFGGADLWETSNGIIWMPVTLNGFNNWLNYGFRRTVPATIDNQEFFFIGTSNPFTGVPGGGCEVWSTDSNPEPRQRRR